LHKALPDGPRGNRVAALAVAAARCLQRRPFPADNNSKHTAGMPVEPASAPQKGYGTHVRPSASSSMETSEFKHASSN